METLLGILTIGAAGLLGAASPGPDFALVTKNSILHGRKAGIQTAIGVAVGNISYVIYALVGISLLLTQSIVLFSIVKFLGAAYLAYLGVKLIMEKKHNGDVVANVVTKTEASINTYKSFYEGLISSMLNPKAAIVYLVLFTQVIRPDTPAFVQALYGLEVVLIVMCFFVALAYALTLPQVSGAVSRVQHHVNKVFGAILVALSVKVALTTNN